MGELQDVLLFLIKNGPGRTEIELSEAIYVKKGIQQRVNWDCRALVDVGTVERRGHGGGADPFRYYPV